MLKFPVGMHRWQMDDIKDMLEEMYDNVNIYKIGETIC